MSQMQRSSELMRPTPATIRKHDNRGAVSGRPNSSSRSGSEPMHRPACDAFLRRLCTAAPRAHNENAGTLKPIHRCLHTICFRTIAIGLEGGTIRARRSVPDDRVASCDRGSARTWCDTNGNEVPRRRRCWGLQFPAGITAGVNVPWTSARPDT